MITHAVHLPQSYPPVVEAVVEGNPRGTVLEELARITLGDWAQLTDDKAARTTVVVGVYSGRIVSVYDVDSYTRADEGRVRWNGAPADALAGHIGLPLPGGPWVRGQSRPLRQVTLPELPETGEPGRSANDAAWDLLHQMCRFNHDPVEKTLRDELLGQVEVSATRHAITIKVPAGIPVLVSPKMDPNYVDPWYRQSLRANLPHPGVGQVRPAEAEPVDLPGDHAATGGEPDPQE